MKKKLVLAVCGIMVVGSLCACGSESKDAKKENSHAVVEELKVDEVITTMEEIVENTTESTTENTTEEVSENAIAEELVNEPENATEETTQLASDSSWPDIVKLVNSKGETTTGYLLADGTYMDRICMVYTYDGKDTWTDTNGVEWSKVVE